MPAPLRTFCLMLAHTGCRLSEALALTAGDIEPASVAIRCLKKRGRLSAADSKHHNTKAF